MKIRPPWDTGEVPKPDTRLFSSKLGGLWELSGSGLNGYNMRGQPALIGRAINGKRPMRRRLLVIVSILVLIASLISLWWLQYPVPDSLEGILSQLRQIQAEPSGDLVASGFIQADMILISTEVSGHVQVLQVDVGDEVSADQVLAQLDTALLDAQIQRAKAELQSAEAKLAEVRAGARPEEVKIAEAAVAVAEEGVASAEKAVKLAQSNVAAAEATLQAAQAELARLRAGPDESEVELAEIQLEMAQQRLPTTWAVRDSIGGAEQRGEVPKGSHEAAKAAVAEAELQIRLAELELEELKAGPRLEDLQAGQAAVDAAQAGVDAARAQVVEAQDQLEAARSRLREAQAGLDLVKAGATSEQIAMAQAQVSGAQAALYILEVQRNKMTLRAPRAGIVLERPINVGEMVLAGSTLFRLADLDQVKLTVYVPGTDMGRVWMGQVVHVVVDSFPERVFLGHVVHISSRAEFTPKNIQTKERRVNQVFAVKIELSNPDHALKPGMPADATFVE